MAEEPGRLGKAPQPEPKGASVRQQGVLDLYFRNPNAAAVAREVHMSERQVRRIVERFAPQLEERRAQRDIQSAARADARRARVQDWADRAQQENLDVLDELVRGSHDRIRLGAVKARQALIDGLPASPPVASALESMLAAKELEVAVAHGPSEFTAGEEDGSNGARRD